MASIIERMQEPEVHLRLTEAVNGLFTGPERWTQAAWGRRTPGGIPIPEIDYISADTGCLCLGAALRVAVAGEFGIDMADTGTFADELAKTYVECGEMVMESGSGERERYLNAVIEWNDHPETTYDEVMSLTNGVAVLAGHRVMKAKGEA